MGDEADDEVPGFYCEIRGGTRTAHLVLRDVRTGGPVRVEATRVVVRAGTRDLVVTLPPGVTAEPGAPAGGARVVPEDGTHVSLQLNAPHHLFTDAGSISRSVVQLIRAQTTPQLSCQACGAFLLRPGEPFRRVLPLPSCHWQAMVSEWCCHGGGARVDSLARAPLGPRAGDCLVGDTHLVLHSGSLSAAVRWPGDAGPAVAAPTADPGCGGARPASPLGNGDPCCPPGDSPGSETPRGGGRHEEGRRPPPPPPPPPSPSPPARAELRCERCGRALGESLGGDAVKLFLTEVRVGEDDATPLDTDPRSWFLERLLSRLLLQISATLCSYRVRVQDCRGDTRMLLWVLNSDTLLLLQTPGGRVTGQESAAPSRRCHRVLKLLYRLAGDAGTPACTDELWARDVKTHELCLPAGACVELAAVLRASSQHAPPSLRSVNRFRVGFLRLMQ